MSNQLEAIQIFCEGAHDVAFIKNILRKKFNYTKLSVKFSELPSPLDRMYANAVKNHAAIDLSLDMAHKFFLPDAIFMKDLKIIAIYNSGGKSNYDKIEVLLNNYLILQPQAQTFANANQDYIVSDKFIFFYDADDLGITEVVKEVETNFRKVKDKDFIVNNFTKSSFSDYAYISDNKATYTWGNTPNEGTLEDLIYPMYETDQLDLVNKSKNAIEDMFEWNLDTVAQRAKKKKSIITVMGQKKKPGLSMSLILGETKLINDETWKTHEKVIDIITFLENFI